MDLPPIIAIDSFYVKPIEDFVNVLPNNNLNCDHNPCNPEWHNRMLFTTNLDTPMLQMNFLIRSDYHQMISLLQLDERIDHVDVDERFNYINVHFKPNQAKWKTFLDQLDNS